MSKQEIFGIVIRHTLEILPELEGHTFAPTDRLQELGANSIDRAEITMAVMEELELNIPRVELFGVNNLGELVDVLYAKSQVA